MLLLPKIRTISAGATIFLLIFLCYTLRAQEKQYNEIVTVDGRKYLIYTVLSGDTPFSISRKFKVTTEDIYKFNPQSRRRIYGGDKLKIPAGEDHSIHSKDTASSDSLSIEYSVGRRETLYSIARKFGTTQEAILKLNPFLSGVLTKGTVLIIKIPIKDSSDVAPANNVYDQSNKEFKSNGNPSADTLQTQNIDLNKIFEVGIFLPFCENLNDSVRMDQHYKGFLEFYSGVLLATEKLTDTGMKVKLCVYDTYPDSGVVEQIIRKPEFLSLDLIIGPVYPEDQKIITELSAKNRIPIVSPLSSDSRFVSTTPGYYQINPGRKLRLASTADYISSKFAGQSVIMISNGADSDDEKFIFDRLNQNPGGVKVHPYNILTKGTAGLELLLQADKENIVVLADPSEANVSISMTRLNTLSILNRITVIGLLEFTKMQSIDVEHFHNTNLHYLAPYFVDYGNPKVNSFIEKYRASFSSEPTHYSFQGYDIALHFITLLSKSGKNFPATNPNPGVDLLQSEYNFQKLSDFGGYINRTLNVIEYTRNYEVRLVEKIKGTITSDHGQGKEDEKNGLEQ